MSRPRSSSEALLAAALRYAAIGFPVFPCHHPVKVDWHLECSCGDRVCSESSGACKHPMTPNGLKNASTDPDVIKEWWRKHPKANVGVVVADNHFVLDVDSNEAAQYLKDNGFVVPRTVSQSTPRGGHHYLYSVPPDVRLRQTAGELRKGVDTRAAGKGYFLAAPSLGINGFPYQAVVPLKDYNITSAPDWMLQKFAERPVSTVEVQEAVARDLSSRPSPDQALRGLQAGQRNDGIFRYACALRAGRAVTQEEARVLVLEAARNSEQSAANPFSLEEADRILVGAWNRYPGPTSIEPQPRRTCSEVRPLPARCSHQASATAARSSSVSASSSRGAESSSRRSRSPSCRRT